MFRFVVVLGILAIDPIVEQRFCKAAVEICRGQSHGRWRFDLLHSVVSLGSKPDLGWRQWRRAGAEGHRHDAQGIERSGQKSAAAVNLLVSPSHASAICRTPARSASQDPPKIPVGERLAAAQRFATQDVVLDVFRKPRACGKPCTGFALPAGGMREWSSCLWRQPLVSRSSYGFVDPFACMRCFVKSGISVLGIHRGNGDYVGVPRGETTIEDGDLLVLYGTSARAMRTTKRIRSRLLRSARFASLGVKHAPYGPSFAKWIRSGSDGAHCMHDTIAATMGV